MLLRFLAPVIVAMMLGAASAGAAAPCADMIMPAAALKSVGRGFSSHHSGIDLLAPYGSPVLAAAGGTVIYAGRYFGYGNMIDVSHGNGVVTRYGHLARFAPGLRVGSTVRSGTVMGNVGATGHATTPHLHFEVRINDHPVDPRPALALAACRQPLPAREPIEEARARGGWAR